MTVMLAPIAFAGLFLAYSNGANDNFKGVATLFGSGDLHLSHRPGLGDGDHAGRVAACPGVGPRAG